MFRSLFTIIDLKEVARYKWDETKYDLTAEKPPGFLMRLKAIAKQTFKEKAAQYIENFPLWKTAKINQAGPNEGRQERC